MAIDDINTIIDEYSKAYCFFLEAAYGAGMMSEGGEAAISRLFLEDAPNHKRLLDIGFGLGGVAMYLAEQHDADVSGLEINPWMMKEAICRLPESIKNQVDFQTYHPQQQLPFGEETFDIAYSKGVLTHLQDKKNLFSEIYRILKPGGVLLIDDWLSPKKDHWGDRMRRLCEVENLSLYAESEGHYQCLLRAANFNDIQMRDENSCYYQHNCDIIRRLTVQKESGKTTLHGFSVSGAIQSYQDIADAILENELLIRWFRAVKPL